MREILFKAKAANREEGREYRTNYKNGDWVYGLVTSLDNYYLPNIAEMKNTDGVSGIEVEKETIGQWTGLVDKNGVKIFEGDIFEIEEDITGNVIFEDGCFCIEEYGMCGTWTESGFDECGGGYGILQCLPIDWYSICDMEVIGNIHDKAVEE